MQEQVMTPQQTYSGVRPPKGWVPPLDVVLKLMGVYDTSEGVWKGLPLQAFTGALVVAEALHAVDRIDERDHVTVTVPDTSDAGTVKTKELEVPAGEVWFINRLNLVTEAEVTGNVRISKFPEVNDVDKKYLATDQAAGADTNYDLASAGHLGAELRLVGGDKLTVVATAGALTTADRVVTLNLYGRKARRLVEQKTGTSRLSAGGR